MKTIIYFIIVFFLLISQISYAQTGWFTQNSGTTYPLNSFCFIDANTGYVVGGTPSGSVILKTTNGGNNWLINYQSSTTGFLSVAFFNASTGYAVGGYYPVSVIMKTTNAGLNWTPQNSPLTAALYSVAVTDANTAYCCADWGHIIKTTNGGSVWFEVSSCTTDYLECIQFVNANTGYAVGRVGQIIKTTNAGTNWFYLVNYGTWLNSVKFVSESVGYTVSTNGNILTTENSGLTWNTQNSGTSTTLNEITFIGQNNGFISGNNGLILNTTNGGINWVIQPTGVNSGLLSVNFVNNLTGFACGMNGTIIKTTNGGVSPPPPPTLVSPPNNSTEISVTPSMVWNVSSGATNYKIQISTVANFLVISDSATVSNTQYIVPTGKLSGGYTYFWRVNASNSQGTSAWSSVWSFSTAVLPPAPMLISPPNGTIGTTKTPTLIWNSLTGVIYYKIQISRVPNFTVIVDSAVSVTSQYIVPSGKLFDNIIYFWRVNAVNAYGPGPWSSVWNFTPQPTNLNLIGSNIPTESYLYNNYPNPFNPVTKIKFDLPTNSRIKIIVYDISGKEVSKPLDSQLGAGTYEINFDAGKLSSGVYFYRLETNNFTDIKKMILIK